MANNDGLSVPNINPEFKGGHQFSIRLAIPIKLSL